MRRLVTPVTCVCYPTFIHVVQAQRTKSENSAVFVRGFARHIIATSPPPVMVRTCADALDDNAWMLVDPVTFRRRLSQRIPKNRGVGQVARRGACAAIRSKTAS